MQPSGKNTILAMMILHILVVQCVGPTGDLTSNVNLLFAPTDNSDPHTKTYKISNFVGTVATLGRIIKANACCSCT